jgi:hypothetical protein
VGSSRRLPQCQQGADQDRDTQPELPPWRRPAERDRPTPPAPRRTSAACCRPKRGPTLEKARTMHVPLRLVCGPGRRSPSQVLVAN